MSRLSDLYKAMETLRKEGLSLNEDLERQVSELEENIINKALKMGWRLSNEKV